jgi:hypothetical protein
VINRVEIKAEGVTLLWEYSTKTMYYLSLELGVETLNEVLSALQNVSDTKGGTVIKAEALHVYRCLLVAGCRAASEHQTQAYEDSVFWEMARKPEVIGAMMEAFKEPSDKKKVSIKKRLSALFLGAKS